MRHTLRLMLSIILFAIMIAACAVPQNNWASCKSYTQHPSIIALNAQTGLNSTLNLPTEMPVEITGLRYRLCPSNATLKGELHNLSAVPILAPYINVSLLNSKGNLEDPDMGNHPLSVNGVLTPGASVPFRIELTSKTSMSTTAEWGDFQFNVFAYPVIGPIYPQTFTTGITATKRYDNPNLIALDGLLTNYGTQPSNTVEVAIAYNTEGEIVDVSHVYRNDPPFKNWKSLDLVPPGEHISLGIVLDGLRQDSPIVTYTIALYPAAYAPQPTTWPEAWGTPPPLPPQP